MATLEGADAVYCGKCNKTTQKSSRDYFNPGLFVAEVIRVTQDEKGWVKNYLPLNFPIRDVKLPGFTKSYRVVATCHHRGTLQEDIGSPRYQRMGGS